ncbi:hypothetical protein [Lacticaseibacillus hegangensis]|nr:hypothetical protein [Lacticaseibacillus hegangensis]
MTKVKSWRLASVATALAAMLLLAGCGTSKGSTSAAKPQTAAAKTKADKTQAKQDATTLLNYMYQGRASGLSEVTNEDSQDTKTYLMQHYIDKQTDFFKGNGNMDDFYLVLDGSNYYANDIIKDFAKAYVEQTQNIGHYQITKLKTSGNNAEVTASFTPIAALSEAHPIGEARTSAFGGLDNDTLIRESQNKDVKSIQRLITLKLYSVYYGDMAKTAEKAPEKTSVTFSMTKKGSHYMVDHDTLDMIEQHGRVDKYAASDSSSSAE